MTPPSAPRGTLTRVSGDKMPMHLSIKLVLPMPPNQANTSRNSSRRVAHFIREKYWAELDERQLIGAVPPPPREPIKRARIRSVMYLGAAMDDDNAMHRHKWALDWLKTRGYIVDDRRKCLTWEGLPEQVVKRDGNYRLELSISRVA